MDLERYKVLRGQVRAGDVIYGPGEHVELDPEFAAPLVDCTTPFLRPDPLPTPAAEPAPAASEPAAPTAKGKKLPKSESAT